MIQVGSSRSMGVISGHATVVATQGQISASLADDEAVILSLESGTYYGLDAVGARVWDLIQKPTAFNDVRDTLLEEYDVDPKRCERELLSLLHQLAAEGLIKVEDATGT